MDDRDFLGYFNQLGSQKVDTLKLASNNIVNTLLALDSKGGKNVNEASDDKVKVKAQKSLREKYS